MTDLRGLLAWAWRTFCSSDRIRWVTEPRWFTVGGVLGIVPADFLMSRDHLLGVKMRAEALEGEGLPIEDYVEETR